MDKVLLQKIADASVDPAGFYYVSQVEGQPLVSAGLIIVNTGLIDPNDGTKCAARITDAGKAELAKPASAPAEKTAGSYALVTGAVLPPARKRGNPAAGAPSKYPFADMEVNAMFFSANTEHKKGDAVKALGSTVSMWNEKYAEPTGEMKSVTRAVRDKTTKKAQLNADGSKVMETVQLPVKKYSRKFTIRPVEGGKNYGSWTAPADGALIARIL